MWLVNLTMLMWHTSVYHSITSKATQHCCIGFYVSTELNRDKRGTWSVQRSHFSARLSQEQAECRLLSEIHRSGFSSVNMGRDLLLLYLVRKANLHTTNKQTKSFRKISIGSALESCCTDTVQAAADRLPSAFLSLPDSVYTV